MLKEASIMIALVTPAVAIFLVGMSWLADRFIWKKAKLNLKKD